MTKKNQASRQTDSKEPARGSQVEQRPEPIAIIGMAGFFPRSDSLDDFLTRLHAQESLFELVPSDRDPDTGLGDRYGAFLQAIDQFDPALFRIQPAEADYMDPRQRLLLMSVWRTLEHASYAPAALSQQRVHVYIASEGSPYASYIFDGELSPFSAIGGASWSMPNRISHALDFKGKSLHFNAACSGGTAALHEAIQTLRRDEADYVMVGAANLLFGGSLFMSYWGQESLGICGAANTCYPYQNQANGFLPAEGVVTLLLKPLAKAEADGDCIQALLLGSHINHGGNHGTLTLPSAQAQSEAMVKAYQDAGIAPATVTYAEGHGASTVQADAEEIRAFCLAEKRLRALGLDVGDQPLKISSIKPNIGHANSVSGLMSLLRIIQGFRTGTKLGIRDFSGVSDKIKLRGSRLYLNDHHEAWEQLQGPKGELIPRRAAINNYGAGGVNVHLIIGEAPTAPETDSSEAGNGPWFLALSTASSESLVPYATTLADYLEQHPELAADQLEYLFLQARRGFAQRVVFRYRNTAECAEKLRRFATEQGEKGFYLKTDLTSASTGSSSGVAMFRKHNQLAGFLDTLSEDADKRLLFELWSHGIEEPIQRFFETRPKVKRPLPGIPFNLERFWVPPMETEALQARAHAVNRPEIPRQARDESLTNESAPCQITSIAAVDVAQATLRQLTNLFAKTTRKAVEDIDPKVPMEAYGIDSLVITMLNQRLEQYLSPYLSEDTSATGTVSTLSKTLFFQFHNLADLANHLVQTYPRACARWVGMTAESSANAQTSATEVRVATPSTRSAARDTNATLAREPIAIIGMDGTYPGADDLDAFWDNLKQGHHAIGDIPADRWSMDDFFEPDPNKAMASGKSYSKWGGFLERFAHFDPMFFNIAPREAHNMDPQERLFIQSCWSALEDAGYTRHRLATQHDSRVGVFVGITKTGFGLFGPELWARGEKVYPHTSFGSVANRISYLLNVNGPSMPIDTMCSASLTAVHEACEHLLRDECELALAGGVNLYLHPSNYVVLCGNRMLSEDDRCRSFGVGGHGFVPGEGVGTLLLKRLSQAEADGDPIHAVIRGTSINHGGKTNGYTVPNPNAQAALIETALNRAGVHPRQVGYIEAHGTGTELGDPIEITGLTQAFRSATQDRQFCAIGSVKTNIGHLEAAAGVAGLTKVVLQMKHQQLAPSLHAETTNPNIDFANSPFRVQNRLTDWQPSTWVDSDQEPSRIAGVSSFGAGGSNAHVVLEEYRAPLTRTATPAGKMSAEAHPVALVLSARTHSELVQRVTQMCRFVRTRQAPSDHGLSLQDLAYSLQVGREPFEERLAFTASSLDEVLTRASTWLSQPEEALNRGEVHRGRAPLVPRQLKRQQLLDEGLAPDCLQQAASWDDAATRDRLLAWWVEGYELDWHIFFAGLEKHPQMINLPTYPFSGERYWLPDRLSQGQPISAQPETATMPARDESIELVPPIAQVFSERWVAQSLENAGEARIPKTMVCLISNPDHAALLRFSLRRALANTADDNEPTIVMLTDRRTHGQQTGDHLAVDPHRVDELADTLARIQEKHGAIDDVLYLWPLEEPAKTTDLQAVVTLFQALGRDRIAPKTLLLAGACESESLEACYLDALIGFERSLRSILTQTRIATLAFLETRLKLTSKGANSLIERHLKRVVEELLFGEERAIRYWDDTRQLPISERVPVSTEPPLVKSGFSNRPTYLITGGLGGLGFLFAKHLVVRNGTKPNLLLIGRSELNAHRRQRICELEDLGALVTYLKVDIADESALRTCLTEAQSSLGWIEGVIHAAGIEAEGSLFTKEWASFERVLAPKLSGTLILKKLLEEIGCGFFCCFSSSAAQLGDFGGCDYAVANRFQMAFANLRPATRKLGRVFSIQWPLWRDGGMGRKQNGDHYDYADGYLAVSGQAFMETEVGLELFDRCLTAELNQITVLVGEQHRMADLLHRAEASQPRARVVKTEVPEAKTPVSNTGHERPSSTTVMEAIARCACELLEVPRARLNPEANWLDFGFNSITLAEFSTLLNQHFESAEIMVSPAIFFERPNLNSLTEYYLEEFGPAPTPCTVTNQPSVNAAPEKMRSTAPTPVSNERLSVIQSDLEDIAVIGMSGRFPNARSIDDFWEQIVSGTTTVTSVPEARKQRWRAFIEATVPAKDRDRLLADIDGWQGGFIPGIAEFDPLFFGISPREAMGVDPRQRLLLQESWKALEDAGYGSQRLKWERIGMFVGAEQGDYQHLLSAGSGGVTGNHNGILAARLAYFMDFSGPAMALDTACSSGLVAAHQACSSLRNDECDAALAAGVNLMLTPLTYLGLSETGMLSQDGRCYAFDERANGMVPSEAVAVVVLKRLSRALADGDRVYAVIRGSGVNYDGKTNGITAPNGASQGQLIRAVYDKYDIDPQEIGQIISHGTGTKLGDPVEMSGLGKVFSTDGVAAQTCALTSIKTHCGHTLAASGLVNLIAMVQSLRHRTLAANLHFQQPNTFVSWDSYPFFVNTQTQPWTQAPDHQNGRRTGAISAFGMSGTNAHMVLAEAPAQQAGTSLPAMVGLQGQPELMVVTGRNKADCQRQLRHLRDFLMSPQSATWDLTRICDTLRRGRQHLKARWVGVAENNTSALELVNQWLAGGQQADSNRMSVSAMNYGEVPTGFQPNSAMEKVALDLIQSCFGNGPAAHTGDRNRENLVALGQLFIQGYPVTNLQIDHGRSPLDSLPTAAGPMPTYAFADGEYWPLTAPVAAPKASRAAIVPEQTAPTSSQPDQLIKQQPPLAYREEWQRQPLPEATDEQLTGRGEDWLIFLSNPQAQSQWIERTTPHTKEGKPYDLRLHFVSASQVTQVSDDHRVTIHVDRPEDWLALATTVEGFAEKIDRVFYLWPLEDDRFIYDYASVLHLIQALDQFKSRPHSLYLAGCWSSDPVQEQAGLAVSEEAFKRVHLESWFGFGRSLKHLWPELQTVLILEESSAITAPSSADEWFDRLQSELFLGQNESCLYRDSERFVCRAEAKVLEERSTALRAGGTYWITGGLAGLGYHLATYLAKNYRAKLLLTGRRVLADDLVLEERLSRLQSLGGQVLYHSVDVCDRDEMKVALERAKAHFGAVHGLFHVAGVGGSGSVFTNAWPVFQAVLAPKIQGALNLAELLTDQALDFMCYFSSTSAILGDFGFCDYAVANRFLLALADAQNRRDQQAVAIAWPLWDAGGMSRLEGPDAQQQLEMYLKTSGLRLLQAEEGMELCAKILSQGQAHLAVFAGKPERIQRMLGLRERTSTGKTSVPAMRLEQTENALVTTVHHDQVQSNAENQQGGRLYQTHMAGWQLEDCLIWDLADQVSRMLLIPHDQCDPKENLADFGFDSINLADFADQLNQHYGLKLSPSVFFGHFTLEKLARFLIGKHDTLMTELFQEGSAQPTVTKQPSQPESQKMTASIPPAQVEFKTEPTPVRFEASEATATNLEASESKTSDPEPIAVIGMSGRFAKARNVDELWQILVNGECAVGDFPSDRPDWRERKLDGLAADIPFTCGYLPGVSEFDPLFFEISPREAENMDPRQRLLLQEAWRALEDAGYGKQKLDHQKVGMFVGVEQGEYEMIAAGSPGPITANHNAILAARLSYFLNLSGPNMAIDTACSSGLVALHQACWSIRNGDCDAALAAGVNLMLTPFSFDRLHRMAMLSPSGRCSAFDQQANGLVPGEAVVVVALKSLSKALADGDRIHALIPASGVNYDGRTNGITAPSGVSQTSLIRDVYDRHQIDPSSINLLASHGTGTKLGDPIELNALLDAFDEVGSKGTEVADQGCAVISTKPTFGHTFAASGLVSLVSLIQALKHQTMPASLHCDQKNEFVHWDKSPFFVNTANRSWQPAVGGDRPRRGAVSAFGMSGTNAHVVVQGYQGSERNQFAVKAPMKQATLGPRMLVFSAKTAPVLEARLRDFLDFTKTETLPSLAAASHSLLNGRHHFAHRLAIVAEDWNGARGLLDRFLTESGDGSIVNLFRGQVDRKFKPQKAMTSYADGLIAALAGKAGPDRMESLTILADLYCQGYELAWQGLFGPMETVTLPAYPFSRTHYWAQGSESRAIATLPSPGLHPLLQRNTSDIAKLQFASVFSGDEFFLDEHRVSDQRILPGVAYLEMARVAAEKATQSLWANKRPGVLRVKNMVWLRPFVRELGELESSAIDSTQTAAELTINLQPDMDDHGAFKRFTFTIESQDPVGETLLHARGTIDWTDEPRPEATNSATWKANGVQKTLDAQEIYAGFSSVGLNYGRSFRAVQKVWVGQDELLAELSLPEIADEWTLHPGILDGALQATIGLAMAAPENSERRGPSLPFVLEELTVFAPVQAQMTAHIRPRQTDGAGADANKLDVDLCDHQGQVCVRLRGFVSRVVSESAGEANGVGMLLKPIWQTIPVTNEPPLAFDHQLVLVCERDAMADRVERLGMRLQSMATGKLSCHPILFSGDDEAAAFQTAALELMNLLQEFVKNNQGSNLDRVLVQLVVPEGTASMNGLAHAAGLFGFVQTAALESSKLLPQMLFAAETDENQLAALIIESAGKYGITLRRNGENRDYQTWQERPMVTTGNHPWKDGGTYLITGGRGGLGLTFAREISKRVRGPRLVLTGRREADPNSTALSELRKLGAQVWDYRLDVSDLAQVKAAITWIHEHVGPLNGILHAAGVLRDRRLVEKTAAEVSQVFAAKVQGLQNLDQATDSLELDIFLLFSSIAALRGNVGQADYAAANGFMDRFAANRNLRTAEGQRKGHTLSVNWPYWRDGGMQLDAASERLMRRGTGMVPLTQEVAFTGLYQAFNERLSQAWIMEGDPIKIRERVLAMYQPVKRVDPEIETTVGLPPTAPIRAQQEAKVEVVSQPSTTGSTLAIVEGILVQTVSALLKIDEVDIDPSAELSEFGFDSISFSEFADRLNEGYDLELNPALFFEHPSITSIAEFLAKSYAGSFGVSQPTVSAPDTVTAQMKTEESVELPEQPVVKQTEVEFGKIRSFVGSVEQQAAGHGKAVQAPAPASTRAGVEEPLAVIGMSGRFPMARDLDEFWANLVAGRDCIEEIPESRWDWRALFGNPEEEGFQTNIKWGGFIEGVDEFDPLFFGISPREAEAMDPQHRLLMTYVWKAIEDAGYGPNSLAGSRTAIFVGTGDTGYGSLMAQAAVAMEGYSTTGVVPSVGPNRMSYFLNIHGPSEPVETACSSSLVAIHRALLALRSGSCDAAVVGGINTLLTPAGHVGFSKAGMLCEDGRCKTFSDQANGYVRGEGVGMIYLKRLSDAERDGDHIYGVIRASAVNHGGRANSLTAPNPRAQAQLLKQAYRSAGLNPHTISYIEAHGTGTELGDPIEVNGLKAAFSELADTTEERSPHIALGSVKSNIGHLEMAAGIAGVLKVLLQMKHRTMVKTLHCDTVNPYIDLNRSPFYIIRENSEWEALTDEQGVSQPLRAGVSSFGFGGANAHIVLEAYEAQARKPESRSLPTTGIFLLSAKSPESLRDQAQQLHAFLSDSKVTESQLRDIAYTLQIGRDAMDERLALLADSPESLIDSLNAFIEGQAPTTGRCFVGSAAANGDRERRDTLRAFDRDEQLRQAIQQWLEQGKFETFLKFWVKGINVDWQAFYQRQEAPLPRRLSLPTYPFARERYWIPVPQAPSASASQQMPIVATATTRSATSEWALPEQKTLANEPYGSFLLVPTWNPIEPSSPMQPEPTDRVLVVGADNHCFQGIERFFPVAQRLDRIESLSLETLRDRVAQLDAVDHVFWIAPSNNNPSLEAAQEQGLLPLFRLVKAMLANGYGNRELGWTLMTFGVYANQAGEAINPAHAGISGLMGSLVKEQLSWRVRLIDLQTDQAGSDELAGLMSEWLSLPLTRRLWPIAFRPGQAANSGSKWLGQQLARVSWQAADQAEDLAGLAAETYRRQGVYVVLGGAGKVGRLWTAYLLRHIDAKVIWLGRRLLDEPIQQNMDHLTGMGGELSYLTCDGCDRMAVAAAYQAIKARYGSIHGVVHAGMVFQEASLRTMDENAFRNGLAIKLQASVNLVDIFGSEDLDFLLFFSSMISFIKNPNQAAYAAGCSLQEAYARALTAQGDLPIKTIFWGYWSDSDSQPASDEENNLRLAELGIDPIQVPEAMGALSCLLIGLQPCLGLIKTSKPFPIEGLDLDRTLSLGAGLIGEWREEGDDRSTVAAPEVPGQLESSVAKLDEDELRDRTKTFLMDRIAEALKLPVTKLDPNRSLERYGMDSIFVVQMTRTLRDSLGAMDSTLFFQYQTVHDLLDYVLQHKPAELQALFGQNFSNEEADAKPTQVVNGMLPQKTSAAIPKEAAKQKAPESIKKRIEEAGPAEKQIATPPDHAALEPIAVIGVSGTFPQSSSVEEMWQWITSGRSALTEAPSGRWPQDFEQNGDEPSDESERKAHGGFVVGMESFDPLFFEISPKEATFMDPRQRLFLQVAWHAFEDAGYLGRRVRGSRTAVYVGVEESEYGFLGDQKGTMTSNQNAVLSARIAYLLDLKGPNMALTAACSSGLVALHQACQALRQGDCEMALVGGASLIMSPWIYAGLAQFDMLSTDGRCRAFDQEANGMVPGEAVAAVILKPLSKAVADGDRIYGCIKASGVGYDGKTNGLTLPNPASQASLVRETYERFQVDPHQIQYVMAHSVGSKLGDPVEIAALTEAYRHFEVAKQSCFIGSIKPVFGHTFAASGIVSLIAMLMAMKHQTMPATLGFETANEFIDFDESPFKVITEATAWPMGEQTRLGTISSTGINGTNAHAVIEDWIDNGPAKPSPKFDGSLPILLSARNKERLLVQIQQLVATLEHLPVADEGILADVSYTLRVARDPMAVRFGAMVRDLDHLRELMSQLMSQLERNPFQWPVQKLQMTDTTWFLSDLEEEEQLASPDFPATETSALETTLWEWAQGADPEWTMLQGLDEGCRLIDLPKYPFREQRFWILNPASEQAKRPGAKAVKKVRQEKAISAPKVQADPVRQEAPELMPILKAFFAKELSLDEADIRTKKELLALGADSITFMKLIREVEQHFGVTLRRRELRAHGTIDKLCRLIQKRLTDPPTRAHATVGPEQKRTGHDNEPPKQQPNTHIVAALEQLIEGSIGLDEAQEKIGEVAEP